jgi:hypothetical protein
VCGRPGAEGGRKARKKRRKAARLWRCAVVWYDEEKKGDDQMLSGAILMQVLFVIVGVLVCAWGIRLLWRSNNKFLAVLFLVLMAGIGFAVYRIFGGNLF